MQHGFVSWDAADRFMCSMKWVYCKKADRQLATDVSHCCEYQYKKRVCHMYSCNSKAGPQLACPWNAERGAVCHGYETPNGALHFLYSWIICAPHPLPLLTIILSPIAAAASSRPGCGCWFLPSSHHWYVLATPSALSPIDSTASIFPSSVRRYHFQVLLRFAVSLYTLR